MSGPPQGHPQGGHYEDAYDHNGAAAGQQGYYQDGQAYYDQNQQQHYDGHQQAGGDAYYDDQYVS